MQHGRSLDVLIVSGDPWWARAAAAVLDRAGHRGRVAATLDPRTAPPDADAILAFADHPRSRAAVAAFARDVPPVVVAVGDEALWAVAATAAPRGAPIVRAWEDPDGLVVAVERAAERARRPLRLVATRRK